MNIKTIQERDGVALIEWLENGNPERAWVPATMIVDETCTHPEYGIPHGDDFAEVQVVCIGPEEIQAALRRHGLWTYADIRAKPAVAQAAVGELVGAVFRPVLQAAKQRR